MATLRVDVLTLFPGLFDGFIGESIPKRAIDKGLVEVHRWNIRDWAEGIHKQVDDRPFGGGPGMVLMAPPVVAAVEAVQRMAEAPGRLIVLTPQGRRLDQAWVRELARERRLDPVLRTLRGIRRADSRGAETRATVDRRLYSLGRRGAGHGRDRRRDATDSRSLGRRRQPA